MHRLHRAFDVRLDGRRPVRTDRFDAAPEQRGFRHLTREVRYLAIERAGGPPSDRPARAADAVDDSPLLHCDGRRECAAQLKQDERYSLERAAEALDLIPDAKGGCAELVGGAEIDAVELAVLGNGVEVNDAWQIDQRQP